jgi:peptidoglycan/xylan/chitin deacetylase (PgdA/CDA1 family)
MKENTTTKSMGTKIRGAITALVIFSLVAVAPVFSVLEFGQFFHGSDSRSDIELPVMTQRAADKTTLPAQLFQEPLITVTFDDGFESIYKNALPLLQKYGIHSTQYVLAGTEDNQAYVNWKQIGQMQQAGHEIACHTMTHPDLTTLDTQNLDYQLAQCKTELTKRFGVVSDFASPYGASNPTTISAISKYFDSHRNTNGDPTNGVNDLDVNTADNFDRYNIIGVTVRHDTSVKQLEELVAYARLTNGWIVLTYHQADDDSGSKFGVGREGLEKQFAYLSSTNVRIVTMHEALQATRIQNVEY